MLIMFHAQPQSVSSALSAIAPFAVGKPQVYEAVDIPSPEPQAGHFDDLAQQIAAAIKPSGKQTMRLDALKAALFGYDSFMDQKGDADPNMRTALGALSKALRPFSDEPSPIDLIAVRTRHHNPKDGHYLGTRYAPTKLGVRVREILEAQGVL